MGTAKGGKNLKLGNPIPSKDELRLLIVRLDCTVAKRDVNYPPSFRAWLSF
jgi:hypothetical protein